MSNMLSITLVLSAVMLLSLISMAKLAAAADTIPPTAPRGLSTATVSTSQITLAWTASTDNVDVTGYEIFRNGTQVGTSATTGYSDTGLAASTTYTYVVSAYDAAGNNSSQPGSVSVATPSDSFPTLGAHALEFYPCGDFRLRLWRSVKSGGISTPSMITQASGSTMLTWVGRDTRAFTSSTFPTDNKGNAYSMIGSVHDFEALYSSLSAVGGSGHIVTVPMLGWVASGIFRPGSDEITVATVEVKNGGAIQDAQWNKVTAPPQTSLNVTTTGPATLVAVWVGDSWAPVVTASPNNGFTVINSQLLAGCAVEAVVATKDVSAAGTYNVTWTATPTQGAHMWLVAVQNRT
ncbi:MAG: hypothetical protein M3Z96_13345 [Pseudomonadota bacterium]|nr:hypothetical protein [Pseudomonadota bacterium]